MSSCPDCKRHVFYKPGLGWRVDADGFPHFRSCGAPLTPTMLETLFAVFWWVNHERPVFGK